jgi:hypothetical protein
MRICCVLNKVMLGLGESRSLCFVIAVWVEIPPWYAYLQGSVDDVRTSYSAWV